MELSCKIMYFIGSSVVDRPKHMTREYLLGNFTGNIKALRSTILMERIKHDGLDQLRIIYVFRNLLIYIHIIIFTMGGLMQIRI
jgi:hypothetical protein